MPPRKKKPEFNFLICACCIKQQLSNQIFVTHSTRNLWHLSPYSVKQVSNEHTPQVPTTKPLGIQDHFIFVLILYYIYNQYGIYFFNITNQKVMCTKELKDPFLTWIVHTLRWIPRPNKGIGPCAEKSILLQLYM